MANAKRRSKNKKKSSRTRGPTSRARHSAAADRARRGAISMQAAPQHADALLDWYPPQLDWANDSPLEISSLCDVWRDAVMQFPTKREDVQNLLTLGERLAFHANKRGLDASGLHCFSRWTGTVRAINERQRLKQLKAAMKGHVLTADIAVESLYNHVMADIASSNKAGTERPASQAHSNAGYCGNDRRYPTSEWITLREAVALHNTKRSTLYRWIMQYLSAGDRGETEPVRRVVIRRAPLDALVQERRRPS